MSEGLNEEGHEGRAGETSERKLGEEQSLDPTLRAAWERAKAGQGTVDSGARLMLHQGILYRVGVDPGTKETVRQLVLLVSRREKPSSSLMTALWGGTWEKQPPWRASLPLHTGQGYIGT